MQCRGQCTNTHAFVWDSLRREQCPHERSHARKSGPFSVFRAGTDPLAWGGISTSRASAAKPPKVFLIYDNASDTFLLSGTEDLVPLPGGAPGRVPTARVQDMLFVMLYTSQTPAWPGV